MAITHQQALEHLHAWSCDDASAKGMSDEQSNLCRDIVQEHIAALEAENANWRQLVESMEAAASDLIRTARPFTRQDAALAVAWSKMRGAMPLRLRASA